MRDKRANCPCAVLMGEALGSNEPAGEATRRYLVAGGCLRVALSPPSHTLGYVKARRPGEIGEKDEKERSAINKGRSSD